MTRPINHGSQSLVIYQTNFNTPHSLELKPSLTSWTSGNFRNRDTDGGLSHLFCHCYSMDSCMGNCTEEGKDRPAKFVVFVRSLVNKFQRLWIVDNPSQATIDRRGGKRAQKPRPTGAQRKANPQAPRQQPAKRIHPLRRSPRFLRPSPFALFWFNVALSYLQLEIAPSKTIRSARNRPNSNCRRPPVVLF